MSANPATTPAPVRPELSPLQTFVWLVKREYWEHRGGFFWTPMIIAAVMIVLVLMGELTAEMTAYRHGINIEGMNLGQLAQKMEPGMFEKVVGGLDLGLLTMSIPIVIAMTVIMFFYLLGALYDDRRDRSVLFWKSLPVSDWQTVSSKAVAALIVMPVMAIAAVILMQLGILILISIDVSVHGLNPFPLFWSPSRLAARWISLLLLVPINAVWALPTAGWLLLCSSFARSRPFLWAVLLPLGVGWIIAWFNLMQTMSLSSTWYWKHVFSRIEFSIVPMSWVTNFSLSGSGLNLGMSHAGESQIETIKRLVSLDTALEALASANFWIGAAAGVVMIAGAIYFRRKRTEAYA